MAAASGLQVAGRTCKAPPTSSSSWPFPSQRWCTGVLDTMSTKIAHTFVWQEEPGRCHTYLVGGGTARTGKLIPRLTAESDARWSLSTFTSTSSLHPHQSAHHLQQLPHTAYRSAYALKFGPPLPRARFLHKAHHFCNPIWYKTNQNIKFLSFAPGKKVFYLGLFILYKKMPSILSLQYNHKSPHVHRYPKRFFSKCSLASDPLSRLQLESLSCRWLIGAHFPTFSRCVRAAFFCLASPFWPSCDHPIAHHTIPYHTIPIAIRFSPSARDKKEYVADIFCHFSF